MLLAQDWARSRQRGPLGVWPPQRRDSRLRGHGPGQGASGRGLREVTGKRRSGAQTSAVGRRDSSPARSVLCSENISTCASTPHFLCVPSQEPTEGSVDPSQPLQGPLAEQTPHLPLQSRPLQCWAVLVTVTRASSSYQSPGDHPSCPQPARGFTCPLPARYLLRSAPGPLPLLYPPPCAPSPEGSMAPPLLAWSVSIVPQRQPP